jgi:hypothetical protein
MKGNSSLSAYVFLQVHWNRGSRRVKCQSETHISHGNSAMLLVCCAVANVKCVSLIGIWPSADGPLVPVIFLLFCRSYESPDVHQSQPKVYQRNHVTCDISVETLRLLTKDPLHRKYCFFVWLVLPNPVRKDHYFPILGPSKNRHDRPFRTAIATATSFASSILPSSSFIVWIAQYLNRLPNRDSSSMMNLCFLDCLGISWQVMQQLLVLTTIGHVLDFFWLDVGRQAKLHLRVQGIQQLDIGKKAPASSI